MLNWKKLLSLLTIFLLCVPTFAKKRDYSVFKDIDFKKMGPHQSKLIHKKMMDLVIRLESQQKYQDYEKTLFSFHKVWNELTGLVINECHAADGDRCLFGGWISVTKNNKCRAPWSPEAQVLHESANLDKYLTNGKCGDGNLFRCNPTIFGPGKDAGVRFNSDSIQVPSSVDLNTVNGVGDNSDPSKGICVKLDGSYDQLSKKCGEASNALDKAREANGKPSWRDDDFFKDRADDFKQLLELLGAQCGEVPASDRPTDGMCESLLEATANVYNAGMANQINEELLAEMGLSCINEDRVSEVQCSPENKGPFLTNLYEGIVGAIGVAENCTAKFAITTDGNAPENFGEGCNLSVTTGALTYSAEPGQELPNGKRMQNYKIVYMVNGEKRVRNFDVMNDDTPETVANKFMNDTDDFAVACNAAREDRCLPETEGTENLRAALAEVQDGANCLFPKVQAHRADEFDEGDFPSIATCRRGMAGTLATTGLPSGDTELKISLYKADGLPDIIDISVNPEMTREEIVSQLTSGSNQEAFAQVCESVKNSTCRIPESEHGRNVYQELQRLEQTIGSGNSCQLQLRPVPYRAMGAIMPGLPVLRSNECSISFDGFARGQLDEADGPTNFTIHASKGGETADVEISIDRELTDLKALSSNGTSALVEFCNPGGATANTRSRLEVPEGQFLTAEQEQALQRLSGIDGLDLRNVEVDERGRITINGTDLKAMEEQIKAALGDATGQVFVRGDGTAITILPNSGTAVSHLAANAGVTLSEEERASLIALESRSINSSATFDIGSIRRESNGALTVIPSSPINADDAGRLRELQGAVGEGYSITLAVDETGAPYADRRYVLRPEADVARVVASLSSTVMEDIQGRLSQFLSATHSRRGDRYEEENYRIEISGTEVDGNFTLINFNHVLSADGGWTDNNSIAERNRFLITTIRPFARRQGCTIIPEKPTDFTRGRTDGVLSLRCPNSP